MAPGLSKAFRRLVSLFEILSPYNETLLTIYIIFNLGHWLYINVRAYRAQGNYNELPSDAEDICREEQAAEDMTRLRRWARRLRGGLRKIFRANAESGETEPLIGADPDD